MLLSRGLNWLRRLLRAIALLAALFVLAAVVFSLCSLPISLQFPPTPEPERHPPQAAGIANYTRDEADTFYTYPEWYIVWSYQAKADFQQTHLPSGFSYFGDIGQFWQAYSRMYAATRHVYPIATGDHIMLVVIGSSLTLEYTLKGLYERTIGRLSEWTSSNQMVAEDKYAAKVAQDYAAFVHIRPFYEFSFAHALRGLWTETPFLTTHLLRTLERRAWLSLDYAVEAAYCEIIELATHLTYGFEDINTAAWIEFPADAKDHILASVKSMKAIKDLGPTEAIVEIPRYQEFTTDAQTLIQQGVRFRQVSGNELMLISAIAPRDWTNSLPQLQLLASQPILTNRAKTRTVLLGKVPELHQTLHLLEQQGLVVEHLYDY
jgi:hypothetical protein